MMKKIILIGINLVILLNFIIPCYSFAEDKEDIESIPGYNSDETVNEDDINEIFNSIFQSTQDIDTEVDEEGGELFTPISQFILAIADGIMSTLQATFIGDENASNLITSNAIKETTKGNGNGKGVTTYRIKYSPAAIFSGQIPVFDINFFEPLGDNEGKTKYYKTTIRYDEKETNFTYEQCREQYGASNYLQSIRDKTSLTEVLAHGIALVSVVNAIEALANTDWDYATFGGGTGALTFEAEAIGSVPMAADLGIVSIGLFLAAAATAEGVAVADALMDKNLYYMQWENDGVSYFYICDSEAWKDVRRKGKITRNTVSSIRSKNR